MRISDWSSDVCSSDLLATGSGSPGTPTGQPSPAAPSVDDRQHDARRVVLRVMDCVNRRDTGRFVEIIAARIEIALIGDRKSVVSGKSVSVRVDLGGRRIIKKKKHIDKMNIIVR